MANSEWSRVQISDVCEFIVDCVNKTAPVVDGPTPYKMVRTTNIRNGRVDVSQCRYVSKETFEKWTRRQTVQLGDVLLTREAPIGEVGFVDTTESIFLGQRVMQYRANPELLDSRFLLYSFLSQDLQHQFGAHEGSGSVVSHIRVGDCYKFKISLPPLDEQLRIAHILGTLDDKIEINRQLNATLEQLARSLFQSWFVDFDPVRAKASGEPEESICRRLGLTPELLALFPAALEESVIGEIPMGWELGKLGDVVSIFDSKRVPMSSREREIRKGIYPYYGAAAIMDYVDDFLFNGIHVLTGEDGSVLNPDGTPIIQYVWGKFWVNNHAHVLKGANGLSDEHLFIALKNTNISAFVNGAVQAKLNQANMKRIPLMLADTRLLEAFGELLKPLFASIRNYTEESRTLAALRDELLPKLLSGDIRLN